MGEGMAEPGMDPVLRAEARSIYGSAVASYAAGRPDYPPVVYETLAGRCGLGPGAMVLENGPGTGLVTGHLVATEARVVAVEPDREMAAYLSGRFPDVEVIVDTFEQAVLEPCRFDLVVAATSFHWVDQAIGVAKVARCLKPGGWVALWWSIFDDPDRLDPFRDELQARTGEEDPGCQRRAGFQLDVEARKRDLVRLGGFENVTGALHQWNAQMDSGQLKALYASLINVARRPEDEKSRLLGHVEAAAETVGSTVTRPFVTAFYCARKPYQ